MIWSTYGTGLTGTIDEAAADQFIAAANAFRMQKMGMDPKASDIVFLP